MAVLCWMAVALALLISAENSMAAVGQNELGRIVTEILNSFTPTARGPTPPMFSVAVSIPKISGTEKYDTNQVTVNSNQVRNSIDKCEVYTSNRVVAATVLKWDNVLWQCPNELVQWRDVVNKCGRRPLTWEALGRMLNDPQTSELCRGAVREGRADHAEYRTLTNFNTLVRNHKRNDEDLMVFYVRASPCTDKCTSKSSRWKILEHIKQIKKWRKHAVVFSDIFQPSDSDPIPENELRGALQRLGESVRLSNIYRCKKGDTVECLSCSIGGQVADYCISDKSPFVAVNLPSTSFTGPQRGSNRERPVSSGSFRGKGQNMQNPMGRFSSFQSEMGDPQTGGGQGGSRRRKGKKRGQANAGASSIQSDTEVPNTDVGSYTGGGQGGSRRRRKGKKKGNTNEGECVSTRQGGRRGGTGQQTCSSGRSGRARVCCLVCTGVCVLCCVVCPLVVQSCLQYLNPSAIE